MFHSRPDVCLLALMLTCSGSALAEDVLLERFDDASRFTTSTPFFSDGGFDYFGLADGAGGGNFGGDPAPGGMKPYSGFTGSFLAGQDLDGEGASPPIVLDWTGIDITGLTNLQFSGDFAEFFDSPGDIDFDDFIKVEVSIDGGAYQTVIEFRLDQAEPDNFNGVFREDTDGDGRGDGLILMNGAQSITKTIAGTGSTLDLRLSVSVNAGDEDFGVDNFIVAGDTNTEPEPLQPIGDLGARVKGTSVNLVWSPVPGATGYNVHRMAGNAAFELLAANHQSDYAVFVDRIAQGVTYTYYVEWIDADGNVAPPSNSVTATATSRTR